MPDAFCRKQNAHRNANCDSREISAEIFRHYKLSNLQYKNKNAIALDAPKETRWRSVL